MVVRRRMVVLISSSSKPITRLVRSLILVQSTLLVYCLTLTANTAWGAQLPSIWLMNSLKEQKCGPLVTENINN